MKNKTYIKDTTEAVDRAYARILCNKLAFSKAVQAESQRCLSTKEKMNRDRVNRQAEIIEKVLVETYVP